MTEQKRGQKELRQYLTFILDGEEYGVPILKVNGIQGWERTTPIPNSPDYVMGIINLRGEVVPIIDLRKRFGLEKIPYDSHTVVIVVRIGGTNDKKRTVGLVVDAVADVHDIDQEQIHSTPEFGGKISDNFVKGLGMIGEKMVILLEIDNLIDWKKVSGDDKNETAARVDNLAA
jgi:purine-binding chemotaxis protein CheW